MLALRALGVGRGDEVIVPANSFIATAEAVSHVNATPRFVDVDPQTHLMTAEHVREALGPRTRAVIPGTSSAPPSISTPSSPWPATPACG